jgi:hypothetical protein
MNNLGYQRMKLAMRALLPGVTIIGRHSWTQQNIIAVVMIHLRSERDQLSGNYPSFRAFMHHVSSLNIVDVPVPSRGIVLSEEVWDEMTDYFAEIGREFPWDLTTMRRSRNLYEFTCFLETFGLDSSEGYLESRSWFSGDAELQRMTLRVVLQGNGHLVDVRAENFREHIAGLLVSG